MNDKKWRRLTGVVIDDIVREIYKDIDLYSNLGRDGECEFIVGCDSQVKGGKISYITTLAFIRKCRGASVYFFRETHDSKGVHTQRRLWEETQRAVETAIWADDVLLERGFCVSEIHSDLNSDEKHKSHSVVAACSGYIKSYGYVSVIKPDSFVASKVADRRTRTMKRDKTCTRPKNVK